MTRWRKQFENRFLNEFKDFIEASHSWSDLLTQILTDHSRPRTYVSWANNNKKALLSWCLFCIFLPTQRHKHIFQHNWKWTSSIQALNLCQTFCSSRAMKRHHQMGKASLEQLKSHWFRGRTNPKGYVTKVFLTNILVSNRIYRKKHEEILAVDQTFVPKRWRSHLTNATIIAFDWGSWDIVFWICYLSCHFLYYALLEYPDRIRQVPAMTMASLNTAFLFKLWMGKNKWENLPME